MKKSKLLYSLLMTIVMMAICLPESWAKRLPNMVVSMVQTYDDEDPEEEEQEEDPYEEPEYDPTEDPNVNCGHNNQNYSSNGNGTHDKVCGDVCGETIVYSIACEDIDADGVCDYCGYEKLPIVIGPHILTHTSATQTCTKAGVKEYWTCSKCNNVFADKACTQKTSIDALTSDKPLGHDYAIGDIQVTEGKNTGTFSLICQREGCNHKKEDVTLGTSASNVIVSHISLIETTTAPNCTDNGTGTYKIVSRVTQEGTENEYSDVEATYEAMIPAVEDAHVYELVDGSYQCKYHDNVKAIATLTQYDEDGFISSVTPYETTAAAIDAAMNGYGSNPRTLDLYEDVNPNDDYSNYYKSYPLTINLNGHTWNGYYKEYDSYYQADMEGYRSLSTGMPITIKNGTFKASFNNSDYNQSELTFDNATVTTNFISWCSTGAVALKNGATLNVSSQFSFSKITIDATSILNIKNMEYTLGGNNDVPGGYADLVHRLGSSNLPEGYTFKVDDNGYITFYDANGDEANSDINIQVKGSDTMTSHTYTGLYKEEEYNYDPEDDYAWAHPYYQVCDMCALTNKESHPILSDFTTKDSNNDDGLAYTCDEFTLSDAHNYSIRLDFTATKLKYNRTVTGGSLVTVCLPAELPVDKVNGSVFEIKGYDQSTGKISLKLTTATSLSAATPYVVMVNSNATQLFSQSSFDNIKVKATDDDIYLYLRNSDDDLLASVYGVYANESPNSYNGHPYTTGTDKQLVLMQTDERIPAYSAIFYVKNDYLPAEGTALSFAFPTYDVTVCLHSSCDAYEYGDVSPGSQYEQEYGSVIQIEAQPGTGHHFVKWIDEKGNEYTTNPLRITVDRAGMAYYAVIEKNVYDITVKSNDTEMGTVSQSQQITYRDAATFYAYPKEGYEFLYWKQDGSDTEYEGTYDSSLGAYYYTILEVTFADTWTAYFQLPDFELSTDGKTLVKYRGSSTTATVPDGVEIIATGAFTEAMTSVTLPNSVQEIKESAFGQTVETLNLHSYPNIHSTDDFTRINMSLNDDSYIDVKSNSIGSQMSGTYSRTMTSEWGTIVLPFSADAIREDCEFYFFNNIGEDNTIFLRRNYGNGSGKIYAGTPLFIRCTAADGNVEIPFANDLRWTVSTDIGLISLHGTFQNKVLTSADEGSYFMYQSSLFSTSQLKENQKVTIAPFHAYLKASNSNGAKMRIVVLDDEATAINVNVNDNDNKADAVYNLQGQKLSAPRKGINIINGKKVMVK